MMADIMFRKQKYDQAVLHFQQLLEHKPGAEHFCCFLFLLLFFSAEFECKLKI